jgi:hypothetical protein
MFNLSAISTFFAGEINESLKRPLRPANLFAAAIFTLLNLVFVYPILLRERIVPALFFRDQSTLWQVVFVTIIVLIISYVLLSLNNSILKLFTGELWAHSPGIRNHSLERYGRRRQLRKYDALTKYQAMQLQTVGNWSRQINDLAAAFAPPNNLGLLPIMTAPQNTESISHVLQEGLKRIAVLREACEQLPPSKKPEMVAKLDSLADQHFSLAGDLIQSYQSRQKQMQRYPAERDYLAPTALGNVFAAIASQVWQRFKIDMSALWPPLHASLAEDSSLRKQIDNDKTSIDFLLNLLFILMIFWSIYALTRLFVPDLMAFTLVTLATVLVSVVLYRASVLRAVAWGHGVQLAFEQERTALRTKLGLVDVSDLAGERAQWEEVSRWLLWGPVNGYKDELFSGGVQPPSSSPTATVVVNSANVSIGLETTPVVIPTETETSYTEERRIDYVVLMSNTATHSPAPEATGVTVLIRDPRIHSIPSLPAQGNGLTVLSGVNTTVTGQVRTSGNERENHDQLWTVDRIPANGSVTLCYQLVAEVLTSLTVDAAHVSITSANMPMDRRAERRLKLRVGADVTTGTTVTIYDHHIPDDANIDVLIKHGSANYHTQRLTAIKQTLNVAIKGPLKKDRSFDIIYQIN